MNIIISGATGYIGSSFIELTKHRKENIYAVVRESSDTSYIEQYIPKNNITVILENLSKLYEIINGLRPDLYINCMGVFYSDHNYSNIESLFDCNVKQAAILLDSIVSAGCSKIINLGSYWQHYNKEKYNPVNLYAATKQAFEDIILYYIKAKGCKGLTLEIFDTYGPKDPRSKVLNLVNRLKTGEVLDMTSCYQSVYYVYIDDLIRGIEKAAALLEKMESGIYEKYSLRDEEPIQLKVIIDKLVKISGKEVTLNYGKKCMREREIIDPSNIGVRLPNWETEVSIEEGLKRLVSNK